jgi:hypothetical protein
VTTTKPMAVGRCRTPPPQVGRWVHTMIANPHRAWGAGESFFANFGPRIFDFSRAFARSLFSSSFCPSSASLAWTASSLLCVESNLDGDLHGRRNSQAPCRELR